MMHMTWQRQVELALVGLAFFALSGCPQEWHFTITGIDAAGTPQFCVTTRPGCTGAGVPLDVFSVLEVPPPASSAPYRPVWGIQAVANEPLRKFFYGAPPPGWKQYVPPEPLKTDTIYSVGPYWFRLKDQGGKLGYEVARRSEIPR